MSKWHKIEREVTFRHGGVENSQKVEYVLDLIRRWHRFKEENLNLERNKLTEATKHFYNKKNDECEVMLRVTLKFKSLDDAMMFKLTT